MKIKLFRELPCHSFPIEKVEEPTTSINEDEAVIKKDRQQQGRMIGTRFRDTQSG